MSFDFNGLLVLLIALFCYYASWKKIQQTQPVLSLILISIASIALKLYISTVFSLNLWDERYHALVAKNMMDNFLMPTLYKDPVIWSDHTNWVGNHVWLHKQPMSLWIIALSYKIFGVNEIALRLPSILASIALIWMTYHIARYLFNDRTAYLAALLMSFDSATIAHITGIEATDHVDLFFMFFVTSAVYVGVRFIEQKKTIYHLMVGACMGAAVLSKWLPGLLVLPIYACLLLHSERYSLKKITLLLFTTLAVGGIIFLPWQFYIFHSFPAEASFEMNYNSRHIWEVIEGHRGNFWYHFENIPRRFGDFAFLPITWFVWYAIFKKRSWNHLGVLIWFLIPYIFFTIVKTKMPAYIFIAAPSIILIIARSVDQLWRQYWPDKLVVTVLTFLILAYPFMLTVKLVNPLSQKKRTNVAVEQIKKWRILKKDKPLVLFNAPAGYYIETMFYIDCSAYESTPSADEIESIKRRGYDVVVLENIALP